MGKVANKKYQIEFQKGTAGTSALVFSPTRCLNLIRAVKRKPFFLVFWSVSLLFLGCE